MYDSRTTTNNWESQRNGKNFSSPQPKMQKILMKRSRRLLCSSIAIVFFLLVSSISKTNAVPTDSAGVRPTLLHRALRDAATLMTASSVPEDHKNAVTSTETMLDQPQGQCLHGGVLIARTSAVCEKKVGCRAIQKTGHCCPDYKCDCERDGKTYSNGDKLVDPETPCTVCYCKGGEIHCSSAVCFHRDDCTPRYIPGRCCPEYDNCPVANKTMVSSTQAPPAATALNPNITIKEITKRTEIRITDENKAKPIHQMLKTSSTTSTIAPTTSTTDIMSAVTTAKALILLKVPESFPRLEESTKTNNADSVENPVEFQEKHAENPISQELHRVDNEPGDDLSKVNIKREFMFGGSTEGPLNVSYIEAINNLSSAEIFYSASDSSDYNASLLPTDADVEPETAGSDNIYHIILSTDGPGDMMSSSTEGVIALKQSSTTEESINPDPKTEGPNINSFTTDKPAGSSTLTLHVIRSTESSIKDITTHHHVEDEDTVSPMDTNPAYPSLPEDDFSIRDVNQPMSEVDETTEADAMKDQQRSIGKMKSVVIDGSGSGSTMSENENILLNDTETMSSTTRRVQLMYSSEEATSAETAISNITDFKMEKIMSDSYGNETGSGDSLEVSSLETIIGSELDGGSGNGSGELRSVKEREPTTPRPRRKSSMEVDIDELGDTAASGDGKYDLAEDPKLDAESLKIDENDNDSVVQSEPGVPAQSDAISVKSSP